MIQVAIIICYDLLYNTYYMLLTTHSLLNPPLPTSSSSTEECHGINPKPSQTKPTPKVGNTMMLTNYSTIQYVPANIHLVLSFLTL